MLSSLETIELFKKEAIAIGEQNVGLTYLEKDGKPTLFGKLELIDENGNHCDNYVVEIHWREKYPYRFPLVFETGGRIPLNIDWHVFESDGHCCITAEPEEILICKKGLTLSSFIEQEMKPYFFNQTFRRLNGYYYKERPHGPQATIDFFEEKLKVNNLFKLVGLLSFIAKKQAPDRTSLCFCGSGNKYRKCHKEVYRELSLFTSDEILYFIKKITSSNTYKLKLQLAQLAKKIV